jgi:hypothetical protein
MALAATEKRAPSSAKALVNPWMPDFALAAGSVCQFWQPDDWSIAHRGDGFQCHVSGALGCPFVVLFGQQGADESGDGGFVREDADENVIFVSFSIAFVFLSCFSGS